MDALKSLFERIRKVRDTEGVHNLLLDCWQVAQERGEAEGVKYAEMLLRGVEEYAAHERMVAAAGKFNREE